MTGMSEGDAQELCKRLELAFPNTVALANPFGSKGLFVVDLYPRAGVGRLAAFYDLPFTNRIIGMTPESAAGPDR